VGFLFLANVLRVLVLVLVSYVLHQPQLADMLHIPLGLFGFIGGCALGWVLLQQLPRYTASPVEIVEVGEIEVGRSLSLVMQGGLIALLLVLAAIPAPHLSPAGSRPISSIVWPDTLSVHPLPLTSTEQTFFAKDPDTFAQKWRFQAGDLSGSILVVASPSWRSQHAPELCFVGNGFQVDKMDRTQLTPAIQARWLSLQGGSLSATYWFQSSHQTTDDLLTRIWAEITRQDRGWALISVLFDASYDSSDPRLQSFATQLFDTIHLSLKGSLT
jgi:exosortase O